MARPVPRHAAPAQPWRQRPLRAALLLLAAGARLAAAAPSLLTDGVCAPESSMNSVVFQFAAATSNASLFVYGAAVQTAVAACASDACACGGAVAASELRILACTVVRALRRTTRTLAFQRPAPHCAALQAVPPAASRVLPRR